MQESEQPKPATEEPGTLVVSLNGGLPTPIDLGDVSQMSQLRSNNGGRAGAGGSKMRFTVKANGLAMRPTGDDSIASPINAGTDLSRVESTTAGPSTQTAPVVRRRGPGRPPRPKPVPNGVEAASRPTSQLPPKAKPNNKPNFIDPSQLNFPNGASTPQPGDVYPDFEALNDVVHAWYAQRFPNYLLTVRRREEGGRPTWTCRGEKTPILCHFRISAKRENGQMVITHVRWTNPLLQVWL